MVEFVISFFLILLAFAGMSVGRLVSRKGICSSCVPQDRVADAGQEDCSGGSCGINLTEKSCR